MNHCVPNWDVGSGTLDGIIPSSDFLPMVKGKWESVQQKKSNCSDLPFVPDHEFAELLWENGQIVMQGQISRNGKRPLSASLSSHLSRSEQNGDAVSPAKPGKDGTLESVVHDIRAVAGAPNAGSSHDEEMVSLLHYPLDDSLEREYCSGFFGDMPNANIQPLGGQMSGIPPQRGIENSQVAKESSVLESSAGRSSASKQINADAAMGLGAGRASGTIPQAGVQAFAKVRTVSEPLVSKWYSNTATASNSRHVNLTPNGSQPPYKPATQVPPSSLDMPPPRTQQTDPAPMKPAQSGRPGLTNFSHFSRPAAMMKANLQSIGISAGLSTMERLKKLEKVVVNGNAFAEPSQVESTTTGRSIVGSNNGGSGHVQAPGQQPGLGSQSTCQAFKKNPLLRDDSGNATRLDDIMDSSPKAPEQAVCQSSSVTGSVALGGIEKGAVAGKVSEPTVTSSSGGSGNSAGRTGKEITNSCKRKGRDAEESECQSEDGEGESVDVKKQAPSRPTTAKRSRAAEVHNQSERRRRDRINEKMRALQELIPNCNKSDKASMLDEAIEYLKTLQLQVQIMSMGGGMCISPMMLPASMHHLQMPQMAHFTPMGMGMGMGFGMGFGMGMLDMGTASGRPVMPLPSMHGPALPGSSIPGPAGMAMTGMPGSGLPMSGIPGPGLTISGLTGPAPPVSGVPAKALSGTARPGLVSASAPTSNSQDHVQNANLMSSYKLGHSHQPLQASHQAMDGNTSNTIRVQTQQHPTQISSSGTSSAAIGSGSSCNGTSD